MNDFIARLLISAFSISAIVGFAFLAVKLWERPALAFWVIVALLVQAWGLGITRGDSDGEEE